MTHQIGIYDHETGETIVRDMTAEEAAERDAEIAGALKVKEDAAALEAQIVSQKETVKVKLSELGLDVEDLKVLGLG